MSADPKECREQATRCLRLAAEANDPLLRDSLTDTAHRWERLAAELRSDNNNLARRTKIIKAFCRSPPATLLSHPRLLPKRDELTRAALNQRLGVSFVTFSSTLNGVSQRASSADRLGA